jgi:ATP/maltotriose-dependent transcriptional regulator MalT
MPYGMRTTRRPARSRIARPGVGQEARELLETPAVPIERALATLINALAAAPPTALILDDLQRMQAGELAQSLSYLLDHRPDTLASCAG